MDAYLQHSAPFAYDPNRGSSTASRPENDPLDPEYAPLPQDFNEYAGLNPGTSFPMTRQIPMNYSEDPETADRDYGRLQVSSHENDETFSPRTSNFLPLGEALSSVNHFNSSLCGRPILSVSVPSRAGPAQSPNFLGDPSLLYGSSLGRASDFSGESYMLPSSISQYLSPDNFDSFDTLRLPPASHLNSPPTRAHPFNSSLLPRAIPASYGGSFPSKTTGSASRYLSPPATSSSPFLSSLVPHNQHSTQMPVNPPLSGTDFSPLRDYSVTKDLSKADKLKRRREFHNVVERRRRDLIKDKIKELGAIVPPSLLNPLLAAVQTLSNEDEQEAKKYEELLSNIKVKETKPNKSTILDMTVTYMKHLQRVLEKQETVRLQLEREIEELESQLPGDRVLPNLSVPRTSIPNTSVKDPFNPDEFFSDILDDFRIISDFS